MALEDLRQGAEFTMRVDVDLLLVAEGMPEDGASVPASHPRTQWQEQVEVPRETWNRVVVS